MSSQTLPPPQGPEYTPCACDHIEPEHEPNAGDCYSCDCTSYRPRAVSPAASVSPPATPADTPDGRERRARYADVVRRWWDTDDGGAEEIADAVMAVADREQAGLRAEVARLGDWVRAVSTRAQNAEAESNRYHDELAVNEADRVAAVRCAETAEARVAELEQQQTGQRAAALREAAAELGRMDYDTDSNDYGYDTYRDAWNGGVMDGADKLRRLAGEAQQDRCPSCDHKAEFHDVDGRCWFTVDHGVPGSNLVCPCAPHRDPDEGREAQQVPAPSPVRCPDAAWTDRPHPPHDWPLSPGKLRRCPGVEAGGGQEDGSAPA